jgi:hypothetical protein
MVTRWNILVKMGNEGQVEMTRWKRKSDDTLDGLMEVYVWVHECWRV